MQNGAFGWASSLTSSLSGQKVSWSGAVGYQASLTDLFLKKPFGSGISQLAAASSYLEKMSTPETAGDPQGNHLSQAAHNQSHVNNTNHNTGGNHHPLLHHKPCNHESKGKSAGFPCEVCHPEYSGLFSNSVANPSKSSLSFSEHHHSHHHHHHPQEKTMSLPTTSSAPASSSHHHHHIMPPPPASVGLVLQPQGGPSGVVLQSPPNASSSSRRNSATHHRPKNTNNNAPVKHFLCPVCHRSFTQKGNLKTHMMIHAGDKPYACQICGKSFTQKGNVDTHMKIHTGEKDFNCRHCGKGFTQRGNLRTHERSVHTKEKPFGCDVCGKSFSQKGNMQTHIRTHNKDDRFPCNLCGKTFSQKGNLKTHMQRHSGTLPARKYGPRKKGSAASRAAAAAASSAQFSNESPAREARTAHLKSTDEDESSSVEHSLDVQQNMLSPSSVEAALKQQQQQLQQHREQQESNQSSLSHQQNQRSPVTPIAVPFNASRFYATPSSSISAPLAAHTASWLTAAGAASIASKGRAAVAQHYDSFLNSYAGFGQHHPSHLTRLTLLPGQVLDQQEKRDSSQSQEYGQSQGQPNPDFSQLLD